MAEKLRRGGPAGETEDQTRGSLIYYLIYIHTINSIYIHTIYPVLYPVRDGACPGGRRGTPRLYNQLMHIFYREVCRKGEADTGGTFGHCRRANRETVEAFSL